MLFDVTKNSRETERLINQRVGKSFKWPQRIKMKGIGSQRLLVKESNAELKALLDQQNTPPFTNIELRPQGMILWFRVKLESWVLVLPFRNTTILKSTGQFSVRSEQWKVILIPVNQARLNLKFLRKMMDLKAEITRAGNVIGDL